MDRPVAPLPGRVGRDQIQDRLPGEVTVRQAVQLSTLLELVLVSTL